MPHPPLNTSYWPADTSAPVLDATVGGVLRAAADRAPGQPALIAGDRPGDPGADPAHVGDDRAAQGRCAHSPGPDQQRSAGRRGHRHAGGGSRRQCDAAVPRRGSRADHARPGADSRHVRAHARLRSRVELGAHRGLPRRLHRRRDDMLTALLRHPSRTKRNLGATAWTRSAYATARRPALGCRTTTSGCPGTPNGWPATSVSGCAPCWPARSSARRPVGTKPVPPLVLCVHPRGPRQPPGVCRFVVAVRVA